MKKILSFEWYRAIHSKSFSIAILIGVVCAFSQAIHYMSSGIVQIFSVDSDYPMVCWLSYLGRDIQLFYHSLYYMLFPILVVVPYAQSYYEDIKSGMSKMVFIKVRRTQYAISKYLVAFLTGGIVMTIPLIISLFIHAGFVPLYPPSEFSLQAVAQDGDMLCNIFYDKPFLYVIVFWIINFLVGGSITGITLCYSLFAKMKYSVYTFGFVFCLLENSILSQFGYADWALYNIADPTNVPISGWHVIIKLFVIYLLSFGLFVYIVKKKDVY